MRNLILLLVIIYSLPALSIGYTMGDLKVLSTEGSWREFFKHALDIRPLERNQDWKDLVSDMALKASKDLIMQDSVKRSDFTFIESLYKWPSLRTDDVFKIKRQELGLKYIKACLKDESPCWDDLKSFWLNDSTQSDLAITLAELTLNNSDSPITTWNFLEEALKTPLSEFYCKKDFVLNALWNKLEIDYIKLGPQGDLLTKIDQTIHYDCLKSLNDLARKKLTSPDGVSDRELAFQILKSQGKVDESLTNFFYTVYLLENPSQGELFNYAWNRLTELAKKPIQREQLLDQIKKLDPLPDSLLTSLDSTKKKAVLRHFKINFPEYLDYYANQCIKFYGGKDRFPSGNPTIHCPDLMKTEISSDLFSPDILKNYSDARKL